MSGAAAVLSEMYSCTRQAARDISWLQLALDTSTAAVLSENNKDDQVNKSGPVVNNSPVVINKKIIIKALIFSLSYEQAECFINRCKWQ